jgi:hypothetical protein
VVLLAGVGVRVSQEVRSRPNYLTGNRAGDEKRASLGGRNTPPNADSARSVARLKFAEAAGAG